MIAANALLGITEADRVAHDIDAGWIPVSDDHWSLEEERHYRALAEEAAELEREQERRVAAMAEEYAERYGEPMADDDDPEALAVLIRIRELEAQLDAERAELRDALVRDRKAGWSLGRLADRLGVTRQRLGQLTPGAPRQRSGRRR